MTEEEGGREKVCEREGEKRLLVGIYALLFIMNRLKLHPFLLRGRETESFHALVHPSNAPSSQDRARSSRRLQAQLSPPTVVAGM